LRPRVVPLYEEDRRKAADALRGIFVSYLRRERAMPAAEEEPQLTTRSHPRIGLVGCVKSKRNLPSPAADLYTSPLFVGRRRWVEVTCSRWFVLSAKHGLVDPGTTLAPYDETLNDKTRSERRSWANLVLGKLRGELGELLDYDFEVHAGSAYLDYGLRSGLLAHGCRVVSPAEGLRQGQQLALYRDGPSSR
jgi:hypothetical protein